MLMSRDQTPENRWGGRAARGAKMAFAATAALLSAGWAMPAHADETSQSEVRTVVLERLGLTKVRDMDFGDVLASNVAGQVVMVADGDSNDGAVCTGSGGVTQFGDCQAAAFGGQGTGGRFILLRLIGSNTVTLTGPGDDMIVSNLTLEHDGSLQGFSFFGITFYRLQDPTGVFLFRVGGTLAVNANQSPGEYSGEFTVDVNYY